LRRCRLALNFKETKRVLFAVDINFLVTAENGQILQQKINRFMNDSPTWFCANSFILNTEKTAVSFHTRQETDSVKPKVKFGNINISCKSETKFLSIHISECMKWDAHVRSLSSKLSNSIT
jgi:hypothetical protein